MLQRGAFINFSVYKLIFLCASALEQTLNIGCRDHDKTC